MFVFIRNNYRGTSCQNWRTLPLSLVVRNAYNFVSQMTEKEICKNMCLPKKFKIRILIQMLKDIWLKYRFIYIVVTKKYPLFKSLSILDQR